MAIDHQRSINVNDIESTWMQHHVPSGKPVYIPTENDESMLV